MLTPSASSQISPLTPGQVEAVKDAVRKLWEQAIDQPPPQGQGWPDSDERWKGLGILVDAAFPPEELCGPNCSGPSVGIVNDSSLTDADGITYPRDGKMSPDDFNDMGLDATQWTGPNNDQFGSQSGIVACWFLAGVLLHEASHQDDDYPWPPVLGPDKTAHACAEADAYQPEIDVLAAAQDDTNLSPEESKEIEVRKDNKRKYQQREFAKK